MPPLLPLLADYAVTPDVFDVDSYSNEDACHQSLELIRRTMLTAGLVRDLRAGEWRRLFEDNNRSWYRPGKELIKKLVIQKRLIEFDPALPNQPTDDQGWCEEALGTHEALPFSGGIIVTKSVKNEYPHNPLVAGIERLRSAGWWDPQSPSVSLQRMTKDYKDHLDLVLRHSNSLQFIDPHLDPTKPRYQAFRELLVHAGNRTPPPLIEVHRMWSDRAWFEGTGPSMEDLEDKFRDGLESHLRTAGLEVKVFIWDHFHDRYLISNLIGIIVPNGFDTGWYPSRTYWGRLRREHRDDVQREFDEASNQHKLHRQFTIP